MEKRDKLAELRSEKIRNMIGQVPSSLVRCGTLIICIVLAVLFIISIFVPYRETVSVQIKIETSPEAHFIYSSEAGFLVSDSMRTTINTGEAIGYIIGKSSLEKIIGPITGEVLMNVNNNECIDKGGLLCIIIPKNHICYGITYITIEDYKKVKQGNKIVMNLINNETIYGELEQIYPLSDGQCSHKIKIKFKEYSFRNKQMISTVHSARIILDDVSILSKFISLLRI